MVFKDNFTETITKNPEMAETIISNEIKKAEALKAEVEKIINSTNSEKKAPNMTNWWNGMGYNF